MERKTVTLSDTGKEQFGCANWYYEIDIQKVLTALCDLKKYHVSSGCNPNFGIDYEEDMEFGYWIKTEDLLSIINEIKNEIKIIKAL